MHATAQHRRDTAVAWMNRGHAHSLAERLAPALHAYDRAIALLSPLPASETPNSKPQTPNSATPPASWANSLGAALLNRAQLLHRLHGLARSGDALAALDQAHAVLAPLVPSATAPQSQDPALAWPRRNLAGTHLNRANLFLDLSLHSAALRSADDALALCAPREDADPVDADLALKARRARGDALGHLLVAPGADQTALADQAADTADDALALLTRWENRGLAAFRPLLLRFARYGARLYAHHQPHFLAEFLRDTRRAARHIPPSDPAHGELGLIAREALAACIRQLDTSAPCHLGDPSAHRRLALWRELRALLAQPLTAAA